MNDRTILVPVYYPEFHCKCGECRHSCCSGWGIGVTMSEYFRLLGQECSTELRQKLDAAMSILPGSTEERYALLNADWTGQCMLQRKDNGYCMLQCECGETAIPAVCRQYPRGFRRLTGDEASCANSCERTLELLLEMKEPLRFIRIADATDPAAWDRECENASNRTAEEVLQEEKLRETCIGILSNREKTLATRLRVFAFVVTAAAGGRIESDGRRAEVRTADGRGNAERTAEGPEAADPFVTMLFMMKELAMDSVSIGDMVAEIFTVLGIDRARELEDTAELHAAAASPAVAEARVRYAAFAARFAENHPDCDAWFEKLLVNHLFFEGFPGTSDPEGIDRAGMAFVAAWALLRFMNVMLLADNASEEAMIDLNAAAFRFMEHGAFTKNAPIILKICGYHSTEETAGRLTAVL